MADRRVLSAAFQLLDSTDIQAANDFIENLKLFEKEPWVVENLISYYMSTQSQRAADLIVRSRNDHDKVIFRRLHSTFDDINTRKSTLKLLLYIVSKKPPWLYKIIHEQILKDVFRFMKNEKYVPSLLNAIYTTTMLLPVIPDGMVKYFDDIFESLLRLTQFSFYNKDGVPAVYLMHLNVGVYSLFARLYGMYPWHYIYALHDLYSRNKIHPEFYKKAIEPMLSTVKLNPGLITASRDSESRGDQWRMKEMHDIVADCASLSLDVTETTMDYESRCPVLITREHERVVTALAMHQDIELTEASDLAASEDLSAPIELAKDSLVSTAVNTSAFFSPSDRLGLSTPPPTEPVTPNATTTTTTQSNFPFVTPTRSTPQHGQAQMKTPHNTDHNTPSEFTTKYTPTTSMNEGAGTSRSRHTSGTKLSVSRISADESIPPSPLRREFTSEPPFDVPKISSVCTDSSTASTTSLSVSNLPHLLEKISDTASTAHDTDTSNTVDSEDEEVESITKHTVDQKTVQSVAEFMKSVNRIRFISMTNTESDADKGPRTGLRRSGSCPDFTEDLSEEPADSASSKRSVERSASIQTTSSNDQVLSKCSPMPKRENSLEPAPSAAATSVTPDVLRADLTGLQSSYDHSLASISAGGLSYVYGSSRKASTPSAGLILDKHILLLNERLRLGADVQSQLQGKVPSTAGHQHTINWSHFGGSTPTDEISIARGQLLLLHTQLLYERQKRELHAERNRRILSKIAKAEKIKESNSTLEEQLARSKDDIFNLQTTIRLQNNEIHRMRAEKTRTDAVREQELMALIKDNERLRFDNEELHRESTSRIEEFDMKCEALAESVGTVESLERDLKVACLEIAKYRRYGDEVFRMKKELLLMGEIQIKYEEKLLAIKHDNHMVAVCSDQEASYLADITKLKDVTQKLTELGTTRLNQIEVLGSKLRDKDVVIEEQRKRIHVMRGEHSCRLKAIEEKYTMSQSARQALEIQMMSLYDQIGRLTVPTTTKHKSGGSAVAPISDTVHVATTPLW